MNGFSFLYSRRHGRDAGSDPVGRRTRETWNAAAPVAIGLRWTFLSLLCVLLVVAAGCPSNKQQSTIRAKIGTSAARVPADSPLLRSVADTLNHLPGEVDLTMRPPEVVVAAVSSRDHQPVYAVVLDYSLSNPRKKSGALNVFNVPRRNGRFKLARPGDKLRYFALRDKKTDKVMPIKKDLTVREVIDDNSLVTLEAFDASAQQALMQPERVEIWRFSDDRVNQIQRRLSNYVRRGLPDRGWRPTPDEKARRRLIKLLNQWSRSVAPTTDWKVDPLLDTLPESTAQFVDRKRLADPTYSDLDGFRLQEAIWLRDIARSVAADARNDLEVASRLFDWTTRNIQLEDGSGPGPNESDKPSAALPFAGGSLWEILLYGQGDAEDRAWVFINLCRQAGLTAVELALDTDTQDDATSDISGRSPESAPAPAGRLRPWLPAVWLDADFYLFDTRLGLPLPGPDGMGVATLAQVMSDASLLRGLDLSELEEYGVSVADLRRVVALIESTPASLSERMARLESALSGDAKVVLTAQPTAVAEAIGSSKSIAESRLWARPFLMLRHPPSLDEEARQRQVDKFEIFAYRPKLFKARVLQFQGDLDGSEGAKYYYRQSRPADSKLKQMEYEDRLQRSGEDRKYDKFAIFRSAKYYASYWLGIATYESGMHEVAVDFFKVKTLDATPDGSYTHGARYNLARAYEALGRTEEAIALYEADQSPQRYGARLRAQRLRAQEQ